MYSLVELGARVLSLTLDNGFISEGAKDNVRRATAALGVDHRFITANGMNEIFRDSLDRFSNVCQGCYKTIYTVALQIAEQEGIAAIVTGLSRGQFFETRLVPGMFAAGRFDPDEIDRAVDQARRVYHATPDAVSDHLDTTFLDSGELLDRVRFIDFFRYTDVPLAEMIETLERSGTWQRPSDTGRSTNCLINAAGIHVHQNEQGHHNYAEPYAWDVRLGHKTRQEALEELDDPMGPDELRAITEMLAEVGYSPKPASVLTLWVELSEPADESELHELEASIRNVLSETLPIHALPQAIEFVDAMPLSPNGKVDRAALPTPVARRLSTSAGGRAPETPTEVALARIWCEVLSIDSLSATDDFFSVGGASLAALEMIVLAAEHFNAAIPESSAFLARTVESLAALIDETLAEGASAGVAAHQTTTFSDPAATGAVSEFGATPLSPGEEALLFEWRQDPLDPKYNVARLYHPTQDLNSERFNQAVQQVVGHQPTLHTSYGRSRRRLSPDQALFVSQASSEVASLDQLAAALNRQSFDLVNGPLVTVHHLDGVDGSAILLRAHHIVCDAGSLDVMWNQIDLAYQGRPLPQISLTYAAHQAQQRSSNGFTPMAEPSTLRLGHHVQGADGYVHRQTTATASQLRQAAGTTPFASALGALAIALRSSFDGDSIDLTVTASLRDRPELEPVVGYFLNPVPLVVDAPFNATLEEVAATASNSLAASMDRRTLQHTAVAKTFSSRGLKAPSGQVMLAFEDLAPAELAGTPVEHRILSSGVAVNDLTFFVQIRGASVELGCEYRGSIGLTTATALLDSFAEALELLIVRPQSTVAESTRGASVLVGQRMAPGPSLAPYKVLESIDRGGDQPALVTSTDSLSYRELDGRVRSLAARLRAVGVGPGDRVGIALPRGLDVPVAILATWFVGASYVPVSADEPGDRIVERFTIANVAAAILDDGSLNLSVPTIRTDFRLDAISPLHKAHGWAADDEAYVIFTSGSTGTAKGVPISHRQLAHSLAARQNFYERPVSRFLLVSNASFDSSVAGLFWTLADGGTLVLPTEHEVHDVDALLDLVQTAEVTHTLMVPSLYQSMLVRARVGQLKSLQLVIVAGESCLPDLPERHRMTIPSSQLVNEYGPTEATVWATAQVIVDSPTDAAEQPLSIPIGVPIPGVDVHIADSTGRGLPQGAAGELWIGGPTLSDGYLNDVGAAFVRQTDGSRYYRTGDRVVEAPAGLLQFLGRIDDQLSVGGVRIEPGEIEAVLSSVDGVSLAAVDIHEGRLVAWIEPSSTSDIPAGLAIDAGTVARARLPRTHVPNVITVAQLPRNINGKLDRSRLKDLAVHATPSEVAPVRSDRTEARDRMVDLWSEAFDGMAIGHDADFFDIGGDSLRAVVLVSLLEERLGRRVGIGELIAAPTPSLLAVHLDLEKSALDRRDAASTPDAHIETCPTKPTLIEWLRLGDGDPLVVLPPGGGNLLRYQPLVSALPSTLPIVGVRLPGADARSEIRTTIETQADDMLAAIDAAGIVANTWRLLGWSTGGLLAWEIAARLQKRGERVDTVILVDTVMPGMAPDDVSSVVQKYAELFQRDGGRGVADEAWRRSSERVSFGLARRRYRRDREAGRTPSILDAERQLGPVIRKAAAAYVPTDANLSVLYLSASESDDTVTTTPWRHFVESVSGQFELVTLPGVHFLPEDECIIGPSRASKAAVEIVAHSTIIDP